MKNLNVILSRTVLIGLIIILTACPNKKKEDNSDAEHLHDQEMHDEEMNHNHDGEMYHDEQEMQDEQMNHDGEMMDEEMNHDGEMMDEQMDHDDKMMDGANTTMTEKSDMMVEESKTASSIIDNYLAIKNALVKDDKEVAAKAAKSLTKSVASFDVNEVENAKQQEAKDILEGMKAHAEHISKMDIAHQRTHFAEINADMKNLLAITGSDRMLYQQYCPMFDDNKGGAWLSTSEDIKNPLFGSKMMKCGGVKQTIALK